MTDIEHYRERKDTHFKGPHSPLSPEKKQGFTGLKYFPIQEEYQFQLPALHDESMRIIEIQTNTGEIREYQVWGYVDVPFAKGLHRLELYVPVEEDDPQRLFIPFKDKTNGQSTYGGGRYIDAPLDGDEVLLDFNMAYNPYCAYDEAWSCPLPPAANWIPFEVPAGEKAL